MSEAALVTIYELRDPITDEPRYVGQTFDIDTRFNAHLGDGGRSRKGRWVQELAQMGLRPALQIIAKVKLEDANDVERAWIQTYLTAGLDLLNYKHPRNRGDGKKPEQRARNTVALNIQLPVETNRQITEIMKSGGYTKTEVVLVAIARMYEERRAIEFYAQELERRHRERNPIEKGNDDGR